MARNIIGESLAASIVFFGSAFFFRKDDPRNAEILAFEKDLRVPVIVDRHEFDPSGFHVYRLLGQVSMVLGIVLLICVAVPGTPIAPSSINAIAGVALLGVGGGLVRWSGKGA